MQVVEHASILRSFPAKSAPMIAEKNQSNLASYPVQ